MVNNRNSIMMDVLLSVVNNGILNTLKLEHKNSKVPNDIMAKFYLGGVINLGIEWLNNPNKYTKNDILSYLNVLIPEDIA